MDLDYLCGDAKTHGVLPGFQSGSGRPKYLTRSSTTSTKPRLAAEDLVKPVMKLGFAREMAHSGVSRCVQTGPLAPDPVL